MPHGQKANGRVIDRQLKAIAEVHQRLLRGTSVMVQTCDNLVAAFHFHMYQLVILANSESLVSRRHRSHRQNATASAHVHGNRQMAVSVFEVDQSLLKSTATSKASLDNEAPHAGYQV